jgi:hypothetical protein
LCGVFAGGKVTAPGDLTSSFSSSSTLMVNVGADRCRIHRHNGASPLPLLLQLCRLGGDDRYAARDADILPAICYVCRGADAATFGGALLKVGPSSSLPTD